jgi:hypothetical protein
MTVHQQDQSQLQRMEEIVWSHLDPTERDQDDDDLDSDENEDS